ncbi:MAG: threonine ammonia-lyase [Acidobacteria bacterium]|nr:threonine ammonia-lyase [Acidobacteriota bacterium]
MAGLVGIAEIEEARARLAPVLLPTPVEGSDSLSRLAGRPVLLKPEHRQRTGSFKIRGAYNLISRLEAGREVVAASAGNHAQGVARAAALTGLRATIFMPVGAALPKVAATRADGAEVRLEGTVLDESIAVARRYAGEVGAAFVHPFDDPLIIAGQGTVGLEISEEVEGDVTVLVPVGGGGLISGVAAALAHARPSARVIGVQAEGAASMRVSLDAGRLVTLDRVSTIADGIAVKAPSDLTTAHVRAHVAGVVTVSDDEISHALILLLERAKAVVEPAGAAALAAILAGKVPGNGPALAVLSGGNVDPLLLIRLIEHGLTAAGRYLLMRIVIDDHPGGLASLTAAVAEMGLNVLEVEHHRVGLALGLDKVEVLLTAETRDPEHRDETVRALRGAGFAAEPVG